MRVGKFGILENNTRYGIGFENGEEHELHCGDSFYILLQGIWKKVTIEFKNNFWILIDDQAKEINIPLMSIKAKI